MHAKNIDTLNHTHRHKIPVDVDVNKEVLLACYGTLQLQHNIKQIQSYIIHHFYMALLSALKQTHCTHGTCDSEWATVSFLKCVNLKKKSIEVVYRRCYVVVAWLILCEIAAFLAQVLCTPFNHAPIYSTTSLIHLKYESAQKGDLREEENSPLITSPML